ncbi:fad binding domain-containing protein [Emericellopsis cladophorae]|uniref:Fad binding domain-containing protein n=1 Tax=Emericellopsis cladophorae TaxID=2686198 RepID=A0A9P9XTZ5_9HYPO|nr:fad binding domain-containing protein [Emericellopsis cladophorae]KAI6777744.1 fad binding domain-containing protein [Emericellopsis cladophorae]
MRFLPLVSLLGSTLAAAQECRCVPGDKCWPSRCSWDGLDKLLGGNKLIKSQPLARSCYDGPDKDLDECAYVTKMWSDQDFQTSQPIGRPYPYNITCAPVDYAADETPGECLLGPLPTYAVNATTREDIEATLAYAKRKNIRLVVTGTGHDLLARSDGYGGLEVWLRHFRNDIQFQKTFQPSDGCTKSGWTGSAIHIDGNYQWRDVYKVAKANDAIVVGGGAVSVGAIGGWASGGGHGPATRNYGLGADQILEAEVMLADGTVVTANHCQNTDLFRAMRGGGPGYGITLSAVVKAHPNVDVVTFHSLAIAPYAQTPENADLLDAVSVLIQNFPDLSDAGFAGYAYWFRNFPGPFIGEIQSGYSHGFWTIGKTQEEADAGFAPVRSLLEPFKDRLLVVESFRNYTDYWSFYEAESGLYDPTGDTSIVTSRLIDRPAVEDYERVRDAVEVMSGDASEYASNVVLLVGGGQNFEDADDETSGLHPAWRTSSFALVTGRGVPKTASNELRKYVNDDITFVKGAATKKLAPNTGGYMNEGDRHDPEYKDTFYGSNYVAHLATKNKYDPDHVFYCPTCVGSEEWKERPDGPLCRV